MSHRTQPLPTFLYIYCIISLLCYKTNLEGIVFMTFLQGLVSFCLKITHMKLGLNTLPDHYSIEILSFKVLIDPYVGKFNGQF